eukprot:1159506-Pelagomonas_calceolata.AAC.16
MPSIPGYTSSSARGVANKWIEGCQKLFSPILVPIMAGNWAPLQVMIATLLVIVLGVFIVSAGALHHDA